MQQCQSIPTLVEQYDSQRTAQRPEKVGTGVGRSKSMVVEPKLSLKLVSFLVFGTTLSHILSLFNSHSPKRSFGKEAAEKKEATFCWCWRKFEFG